MFYPAGAPRENLYSRFAPILVGSGKLALVARGEEQVLALEQVPEVAGRMLKGQVQGRYLIDVGKK